MLHVNIAVHISRVASLCFLAVCETTGVADNYFPLVATRTYHMAWHRTIKADYCNFTESRIAIVRSQMILTYLLPALARIELSNNTQWSLLSGASILLKYVGCGAGHISC